MKTIQISQRFKETLLARYNPNNAIYNEKEGQWEIQIPNPLCKSFSLCKGCPFNDCIFWIQNAIRNFTFFEFGSTEDKIFWYVSNNKRARRQLNSLRKKMEKAIIWVD